MTYIYMPLPTNKQINDRLEDYETSATRKRPATQSDFQSLFEVAAARLGMGREFKAIKVCHDAGQILQRLLPDFAGQYRVATFREGVLTIVAGNPGLLQKIQMQSHHLLQEMNTVAGSRIIDRIKMKNG